jgi:hypothetical protein
MRQVEVARDAVFSAKTPQAQRGRRVLQRIFRSRFFAISATTRGYRLFALKM